MLKIAVVRPLADIGPNQFAVFGNAIDHATRINEPVPDAKAGLRATAVSLEDRFSLGDSPPDFTVAIAVRLKLHEATIGLFSPNGTSHFMVTLSTAGHPDIVFPVEIPNGAPRSTHTYIPTFEPTWSATQLNGLTMLLNSGTDPFPALGEWSVYTAWLEVDYDVTIDPPVNAILLADDGQVRIEASDGNVSAEAEDGFVRAETEE